MADRNGGAGGYSGVPQAQAAGSLAINAANAAASSGVFHGTVPNQAAAAAASASGSPTVSPHWEFVYRVAERFGIPAVILGFVLYWARTDLIQPLLDAHFQFLHKIGDAHEKQADKLGDISDKLDTLIRVQRGE
jgi:hypothetical protein